MDKRPVINMPIDKIYCKHEKDYSVYRNNYKNQLKDLLYNQAGRFTIERERNIRLSKILAEKGELYPIALHHINQCDEHRNLKTSDFPYICVDGHHRIMAYLTAGYENIPAFLYKDPDEAGRAKANAPHTDYYKDLMEIDKDIHG